jgi:membrane-bound serine protease (ClpP class)
LDDDPSLSGGWRAVRVALEGPITPSLVSRTQRTIENQIRDHGVNFICLSIDSPGGSLSDSMNLANFLADQDPAKVRIVAYVPTTARADAALVAMAADQLVMNHDAVLGGEGDAVFSAEDIKLTHETLRDSLAPKKGRPWSLTAALIDPELRVFRYTNRQSGMAEYFSEEELAEQTDPETWNRGAEVTRAGEPLRVTGDRAGELGIARHVVQDFAGFKHAYALEGDMALAEPSWADFLIDALAAPAVAWLLLLIGGAALYAELQAPGIGVGAFVAGICFLLYFWSKHLDGTAGWLEVLLFMAGVCCILLELFVLPGSAIFGLGGGLLIIASLILASQTFVVPHNEYQMRELRDSMLGLLAVGVGIGVAAMFMRRYLPHTPLFSNLMLEPPSDAEREDLAHREALVDFGHLLGQRGVATTQLTPSGKARFAGELVDVIADSEVIGRGTEVVVTEVQGNRVVVRSGTGRA